VILEGLARVLPGVPVVSEEAGATAELAGDAYFLVDPLDGTRELVAGRDEFCVNIALVLAGRARLGLIGSPALGLIWRTARRAPSGDARARGSKRHRAQHDPDAPGPDSAIAAISRSHSTGHRRFSSGCTDRRVASGSALKLCRVAEGTADVYPGSRVCQWDLAAGDAIVTAAGGLVTTPEGPSPMTCEREASWSTASSPGATRPRQHSFGNLAQDELGFATMSQSRSFPRRVDETEKAIQRSSP
jgi:3'(2'), 5'-bisphosphate nucleotidase